MKKLSTRILTIYCIALVIGSALLIAASPFQTGEPPAPVDPFSTVLAGILALVSGVVTWLLVEFRKLKTQTIATLRTLTADNWEWVLDAIGPILVRAIGQAAPRDVAELAVRNFVKYLFAELYERYSVTVLLATQNKVEAALMNELHRFYAELKTSTLYPTD